MPSITYNKLVRDKIPQIIEQTGKTCTCETLSSEQYIDRLNEKLLEEVREYLESDDISEIADITEVILAILEYQGVSTEELENIRIDKLHKRGGFKKRILLKEVIEETND